MGELSVGFVIGLLVFILISLLPTSEIIECEKTLPRNERCVMIAVPECQQQQQDNE